MSQPQNRLSYLHPKFNKDLFISYAHIDNLRMGDELGWVSNFHRALEVRIGQLLGSTPQIWRDPRLEGNEDAIQIWGDPELSGRHEFALPSLAALHSSAVLVCVLSPGYLQSKRCLWELQEYVYHNSDADLATRIFKIVTSPTRSEKQPAELVHRLGYEFYEMDPDSGRIQLPMADRAFWLRLDDLANDIVAVLEGLQEQIAGKRVEPPARPKAAAFKIVESGGQSRPLRVFLCHASQDKPRVRDLYQLLIEIGVDAWLDEEKLIPGQLWEGEIRKALRSSDAVVVCLSRSSLTKTGYIQKEIRQVLDVADEYPEEAIFLIPARFEDCAMPERFSRRHWVNLFEERGKGLLIRALELRTSQLIAETSQS
jgi:TIR domain